MFLDAGLTKTLTYIIIATVKENSRSLFNFDTVVDWHQRHEFLKCKSSDICPVVIE